MRQYYLPVFFWCRRQLLQHKAAAAAAGANGAQAQGQQGAGPLVLGISAPQGCGKTTLCEQLQVPKKKKLGTKITGSWAWAAFRLPVNSLPPLQRTPVQTPGSWALL